MYKSVLAKTEEQKKLVYSIRYQAYLDNNSIEPQVEPYFKDEYDDKDNIKSFLLYKNNIAIGSIRVCIYDPEKNWEDIPAIHIYKKELMKNIGLDNKIIETNKFVILPEYQSSGIRSKLELIKNVFKCAITNKIDFLIIGVKERHVPFYRKMNYIPVSRPKAYPDLKFKPLLMICDFKKWRAWKRLNKNTIFKNVFPK